MKQKENYFLNTCTNLCWGPPSQEAALQERTLILEAPGCTQARSVPLLQMECRHQEQHYQQVEGGDPVPLLSTGEDTPGVLCPVWQPQLHQRHRPTAESPTKSHKDDEPEIFHKGRFLQQSKKPSKVPCFIQVSSYHILIFPVGVKDNTQPKSSVS